MMKFVRIDSFFGYLDHSDDYVPDSSVPGWIGVEEPVALTKKSFHAAGRPKAISWVHWDALDGEVRAERLHHGVDVIFPLGVHVINLCHLGPVVMGDPLLKLS